MENRAHKILRMAHDHGEAGEPATSVTLFDSGAATLGELTMLRDLGYVTIGEVDDQVGITTKARDVLGLRPADVMELPVTVAEQTGNIAESELVARYLEAKVASIDANLTRGSGPNEQAMTWRDAYRHMAVVLTETAAEVRQHLHIPSIHLDGVVIGYNEDRSTGISHAIALTTFFQDVHQRNVAAGWWTDLKTGEPKKRSVGELFILMVTELVEAYDAYVSGNTPDDKLPDFPGLGVEMGDLLIRIADFAGAAMAGKIVGYDAVRNPGDQMFHEISAIADSYERIRKTPEAVGDPETGSPLPAMDIGTMVDAKLAFNAVRADHKPENRIKEGGKQT